MNLPHTGPFKCHICTYNFKEKTKLIKHIKLLHSPTEDNISDEEDCATEKSLSATSAHKHLVKNITLKGTQRELMGEKKSIACFKCV